MHQHLFVAAPCSLLSELHRWKQPFARDTSNKTADCVACHEMHGEVLCLVHLTLKIHQWKKYEFER